MQNIIINQGSKKVGVISNGVDKWIRKDGEIFLRRVGIRKDQKVLDFGCGEGHYMIPAAKVVGKEGKVYAVEKEEDVLKELMRRARSEGLENIHPMKTSGELKIDLENESVDVVLLYDVLHYLEERRKIYQEVYRILKPNGFLSVYPKHHKADEPLWEFANLQLSQIIREVEAARFRLARKISSELVHDDSYNRGSVLNFTPSGKY